MVVDDRLEDVVTPLDDDIVSDAWLNVLWRRVHVQGGIGERPMPLPTEIQCSESPAGSTGPEGLLKKSLIPPGGVEVDPHLNGEVATVTKVEGRVIDGSLGILRLVIVQAERQAEPAGREGWVAEEREITAVPRNVGPVAIERPVADQIVSQVQGT